MSESSSNLFDLVSVVEVETEDETVSQIQDIMSVVDILDSLSTTDIMFKLSYIGGEMLFKLASKCTSVKLLEIPEEEIDGFFGDEEKAYLYGCYLLSAQPHVAQDFTTSLGVALQPKD